MELLTKIKDWGPYMNSVIAKARRASEDLGWAYRRDTGLRPRSAATLWKALVRPVLEYAAEIWAGDLSASICARAEAVQTNFARAVLGVAGCQSIAYDVLWAWRSCRLGGKS